MLTLKKYLIAAVIISTNLLFFNCKTKKIITPEKEEIVFINKKIHKEIPSPDKSKILILEYEEKMELPIVFNYKVIDVEAKKEFISGIFSGLKMEWQDNTSIRAYSYLAVIEMDNQNPQKSYEIIKIE